MHWPIDNKPIRTRYFGLTFSSNLLFPLVFKENIGEKLSSNFVGKLHACMSCNPSEGFVFTAKVFFDGSKFRDVHGVLNLERYGTSYFTFAENILAET